jgi:hypothetical protein
MDEFMRGLNAGGGPQAMRDVGGALRQLGGDPLLIVILLVVGFMVVKTYWPKKP